MESGDGAQLYFARQLDAVLLVSGSSGHTATRVVDLPAARQRNPCPWLLQLEFTKVHRTGHRRGSLSLVAAGCLKLALLLQLPMGTRDGELAEAAWAAGAGVLAD